MRANVAIAVTVAAAVSLFAPLAALAQDYEQHWRRCVGREGVRPD